MSLSPKKQPLEVKGLRSVQLNRGSKRKRNANQAELRRERSFRTASLTCKTRDAVLMFAN